MPVKVKDKSLGVFVIKRIGSNIQEEEYCADTRSDVIYQYKKYYPNRKIIRIKPSSKFYTVQYIEKKK